MKIAILGYSEAALTLIFDILESQNRNFELLVINNLKLKEQKSVNNSRISFRILENLPLDFNGEYLMGTINVENKFKLFNSYNLKTDVFVTIQHSSAIISSTTFLGKGCIINAGTIIAGQSSIGNLINLNRKVSIGHHTVVGDFCNIGPGCNIAGHVNIGSYCQFGIGCNVIDNVTIGTNCLIGAGSLVLKNIPENCVAYGNPCKVIRENKPLQPNLDYAV